ncbi:four-carbon acid sugar kinase family protein [Halorarum halophilum]|uniref:Four-carbon acid sugar kinase family protein n=1 Tax=Halorarum halophilum TaxID=2743090 RepID=A0A7D5GBA5_9EURY|nr:four-carbon acid sugar kinase family protein [Halobaculum halophilum]QLG27272.1 four-carbon acid sugar kinase family protein [Halobaculum halophilum]
MACFGLVVADDLTGATDTGHEFAARGLRTLVSVGAATAAEDGPPADVRVVDTDSRYVDPEVAAAAVRRVIGAHDASFVYKKVDSTLRGNVVAEVDAALDATGADLALVAPASPRNGRTTVEGYHLVDGVLVAETDAGDDPERPVDTSHLPTRFAGSSYPVVRLPVDRVAAGADAVADDLRATAGEGRAVVVADAVHERHLEALATGAAKSGCSVVYVGSAGLARYVKTPPPTADGPPSVPTRERSVLCVVGSTNPATLEQVRALHAESVVPLDLEAAIDDPGAASDAAASACAARLDDAGFAALVSAPDSDAPARALEAGRRLGLEGTSVRTHIAEALAGTVERLWHRDDDTPESLFVTGGAVASDVFDVLDAEGVLLSGEAVEEGIPLGCVAGGVADETPVVTKAGAFGSPGAIRKCAARLGGRDEFE